MGAIAGIHRIDGSPVRPEDLEKMAAILSHRGPDGSHTWHKGGTGFCHLMMHATPESLAETLPLADERKGLAITADARIDNRDELIQTLGLRDVSPVTVTDSDLILAAYEKWGEDCPEKLLGDFAFAILDQRKKRLFCVRDCFGIKSLYYYYLEKKAVVFATEIKAFFPLTWVPRVLNELKVADYLDSFGEDKTLTFYQGILRLPPAHCVIVTPEGLSMRAYWSPDPHREMRLGSDEAYKEAFREVFSKAVSCRLRSVYPVGITLSGGLDSSAVACMAERIRPGSQAPFHTFSAVFHDVPECDESLYIEKVLARYPFVHHDVHPDRIGALSDIDRILWHLDQPLRIRNVNLWLAIYRSARAHGVRVLLDGEDGDAVVPHGLEYFIEMARAGEWERFARESGGVVRHYRTYGATREKLLKMYGFGPLNELAETHQWAALLRAAGDVSRFFKRPKREVLLKHGLKTVLPPWLLQLLRRPGNGAGNGEDRRLAAKGLDERTGFREWKRSLLSPYSVIETLKEAHTVGITSGLTPCVEEESDKISAMFGIEKRHPFWDRRLVTFCLSLPADQKIRSGWPRWILRYAMDGILPGEVSWRIGKSNLTPHFKRSFLELEKECIEEVVLGGADQIKAYVDTAYLKSAYQKQDANTVWPGVLFALWARQIKQYACMSV